MTIRVVGNTVRVVDDEALELTEADGLLMRPEVGEHEENQVGRVRARSISIKRLSKRELERGRMLYPDLDVPRPESRADCLHGPMAERPCPFISCKHHLYLDVNDRTGSIKLNFPDREVWEIPETCALDVADRGGLTLEELGAIMNLTRERVRQLETSGLTKLMALSDDAMTKLYDIYTHGDCYDDRG